MRNLNVNVLSALDASTTNGAAIDTNQLVSASFQAYFGDATAGGTFKLQASNDPCAYGNLAADFTPSHWVDVPNQTASIVSGASALLTIANMSYRWMRAVYTSTATGAETVATIADTGVAQISQVICVADVAGSLNNKYFLISSVNATSKAQKNFYVWYNVNSAGTDPLLPGKTAVPVALATGATNAAVATATGLALAALTNDFASATPSTATIPVVNAKPGLVTVAANGAATPGFTITTTTPGVNSNLNNTYFLLYSASNATAYYVWFNVASIGTDPAVAGKTAIPVAISAAASAGTVGSTMATAVAGANSSADFTATGTTTVTITNKVAGPFTAASDVSTGFTITQTAGGTTTVNVTMNALGM